MLSGFRVRGGGEFELGLRLGLGFVREKPLDLDELGIYLYNSAEFELGLGLPL